MNDNIKAILTVGGVIIAIILLNSYINSKSEDNEYSIKLNNEKMTICGQDIYITDYTYNDEILLDDLIEEIEYICNN